MGELEDLNVLKLRRRQLSAEIKQAEDRIGELWRAGQAMRQARRIGEELRINHGELEAMQANKRRLEARADKLTGEIRGLAKRITEQEAAIHRQARDAVYYGWQAHADGGPRWEAARMVELVETAPV